MKINLMLLVILWITVGCNSGHSMPTFMKEYPLGKSETEIASKFGGIMVDRSCNKQNLDDLLKIYGGKEAKCRMFNSKAIGSQTIRYFFMTDDILRKGSHNFIDTTSSLNNHKNAMKVLDSLVQGIKPDFIYEAKQNNTKYNRYYVATWEWDTGFFTANVMCTMIQVGEKWEFPKNIKNCYAFKIQYQYKTEKNQIEEITKVNHIEF